MNTTYSDFVDFVRDIYKTTQSIPLHEPRFSGREKEYVVKAIESTYVSSVGPYVDLFEEKFSRYVGSKYAIAVVNGTAALHVALESCDIQPGDEVITQPLTFVATANAIRYCDAVPVFVDVERDTLGLSPSSLENWLDANTEFNGGVCRNVKTGRVVRACIPVHTFGHLVRAEELKNICDQHGIVLIEDAAEALGSRIGERYAGTFGELAAFSFNGNKIITSGGGGMVTTDDKDLAERVKHLSTTAKRIQQYEYVHDEVGYNYRMPNINAALGCAQLEGIDTYLSKKRLLAQTYESFFQKTGIYFVNERGGTRSNYWLNSVLFSGRDVKEEFLSFTNDRGVCARPAWRLINELEPYSRYQRSELGNSSLFSERLVNIPSSVPL